MEQPIENHSRIEGLTQKIKLLESELMSEMAKRRAGLAYGMERGKILFEEEVLRRHRALKIGIVRYIAHAQPLIILTAPFIYMMIVPLLLLDLFITLYQLICFPVYKISKVKRADYFVFDRQHLAYLNILQKVNCAYCSYGNGLIAYVREIAGRTEAYWCPIKHARRVLGEHEQYMHFSDFGDAEGFQAIAGEGAVGKRPVQ
jgi:hypothetical protein